LNTGRASNTGRVSDEIVQIEAGGFYSRKYGKFQLSTELIVHMMFMCNFLHNTEDLIIH